MERDKPKQPEQIITKIVTDEAGLKVNVTRVDSWHFANQDEALRYFEREYIRFSAMQWGLRGLILAAFLQAGYGIKRSIEFNDPLLGVSSFASGVLIILVRQFNAREMDIRVHKSRAIVDYLRRLQQLHS